MGYPVGVLSYLELSQGISPLPNMPLDSAVREFNMGSRPLEERTAHCWRSTPEPPARDVGVAICWCLNSPQWVCTFAKGGMNQKLRLT